MHTKIFWPNCERPTVAKNTANASFVAKYVRLNRYWKRCAATSKVFNRRNILPSPPPGLPDKWQQRRPPSPPLPQWISQDDWANLCAFRENVIYTFFLSIFFSSCENFNFFKCTRKKSSTLRTSFFLNKNLKKKQNINCNYK